MITTKDFPDREFSTKEDLFKALRENKKSLKASKLLTIKHSDAVSYATTNQANKADKVSDNAKEIEVKFVVNSCGWYDSHGDVHLKGCWNKTANDNKRFIHLQEHKAQFDNVISYNSTPSVEEILVQGKAVDALVATSLIEESENKAMFDRYKKGVVKEHSVGMQYIWDKLHLAINSEHEEDKEEKETWDKYIDQVINREDVEEKGYFWGVGEAKALEGSAVVFGSNSQTPVLSIQEIKNIEPSNSTQDPKPSNDTSNNKVKFSINQFN